MAISGPLDPGSAVLCSNSRFVLSSLARIRSHSVTDEPTITPLLILKEGDGDVMQLARKAGAGVETSLKVQPTKSLNYLVLTIRRSCTVPYSVQYLTLDPGTPDLKMLKSRRTCREVLRYSALQYEAQIPLNTTPYSVANQEPLHLGLCRRTLKEEGPGGGCLPTVNHKRYSVTRERERWLIFRHDRIALNRNLPPGALFRNT